MSSGWSTREQEGRHSEFRKCAVSLCSPHPVCRLVTRAWSKTANVSKIYSLYPNHSRSLRPPLSKLLRYRTRKLDLEYCRHIPGVGALCFEISSCIVDVWSFRSSFHRDWDDSVLEREQKDCKSYDATEKLIEILQPDVLIILQTATTSASYGFARRMSFFIRTSWRVFLHKLRTGKQVIVVNSFHPMYALRFAEGSDVAQLRQAMIRFNILQAVNRVIVGNGETKLPQASRRCLGSQPQSSSIASQRTRSPAWWQIQRNVSPG